MMPGNGINYEKCNNSKKIDKKKFFFVFFSYQCCNTINTTKIMQTLLTDLDRLQQAIATDSLLFGIVLGSFGTLLLLALGHIKNNKKQ